MTQRRSPEERISQLRRCENLKSHNRSDGEYVTDNADLLLVYMWAGLAQSV